MALLDRPTRVGYERAWGAIRRRAGLSARTAHASGLEWPYLEGGPADAPVILLVHGFSGDKDNWSLYARHLTRRYRVIAPDLPGFGENDRSVDRDYSLAAQTERIRELLDSLGVETCHLVGNSMGGYIALLFAAEHPDRLRTVTAIDNGGVAGAHPSELDREVAKGLNPLSAESLDDMRRVLALATYRKPRLPRPVLRMLLEDRRLHEASLNAIFWAMMDGNGTTGNLDTRLPEITTPTLIIWGRADRIVDPSCVEVMTKAIPRAEAVIIEKAGHIPMIERPAETAKHQLGFLARHEAAA